MSNNPNRGSTLLLERPELKTVDNFTSCDDCPEVNSCPPRSSDCPYFESMTGGPLCIQEGNLQKRLERLDSQLGANIGSSAISLVGIAESQA